MALGRRWFGKLKSHVQGREAWERQDAGKVWSDGGEIKNQLESIHGTLRTALDAAAKDMERIVADNAIVAVSDFASDATAALRAEGNSIIIGIRFDTKQAAMIVEVPLDRLIIKALEEIRPTLGVDTQAQEAVSALVAFGRKLANLGQAPQVQPRQAAQLGNATQQAQARGRINVGPVEAPPFPGPVMA
jgi:hypothetical protein